MYRAEKGRKIETLVIIIMMMIVIVIIIRIRITKACG